jgi:hypothetical protein
MSTLRRRVFSRARLDRRPRALVVFGLAFLFAALGMAVFLV